MRATPNDPPAVKSKFGIQTPDQKPQECHGFSSFASHDQAKEKINGPGPYDSKLHHFVLIKNMQAVINRYEIQDQEPTVGFDMNIVRLGDIAVASNPFELYLYYGQNIKARSHAAQTFLVQLAAGADHPAGYLPSPDADHQRTGRIRRRIQARGYYH